MDGLGKHDAQWSKSDRERQILHVITYMCNLKQTEKPQQTHRYREQIDDCQRQGVGKGWTESLGLVDANYYI